MNVGKEHIPQPLPLSYKGSLMRITFLEVSHRNTLTLRDALTFQIILAQLRCTSPSPIKEAVKGPNIELGGFILYFEVPPRYNGKEDRVSF